MRWMTPNAVVFVACALGMSTRSMNCNLHTILYTIQYTAILYYVTELMSYGPYTLFYDLILNYKFAQPHPTIMLTYLIRLL